MKHAVSAELAAFAASGLEARAADLYTFTLATGTVLRWTNSDRAWTWGGQTYALGPGIRRTRIAWRMGLEVSECDVTITPTDADLVGGVPLARAVTRGDFARAGVRLDRAYINPATNAIVGVRAWYFSGRIGPIRAHERAFVATVRSPHAWLDQPVPRNVIQPECLNTLFDSVCGLNAAAHRVTGSVTGGVTAARNGFNTGLGQASGHFLHGRFRWLTGANAGRSAQVREHTQANGSLWFAVGWPEAVVAGDTFEIWPGCDKRLTTCGTKFANAHRHRGFPSVPAAETTL